MRGTLSMRKIKEILRLNANGLKQRQIARSLNVSVGAVHKYLHLAQAAGLAWPLAENMDDHQIKAYLFQTSGACKPEAYSPPDCSWIHQELKHKGITLKLLHEEYKQLHPQTYYQYTQFCHIYQAWKKKQRLSLRQVHKAGECLFVDYAGPTIPIVDLETGESFEASIFVAILGASNYTYAESTRDQSLYSWIGSHVRAFEFFGGVPELIIPDNLRAGVSQAHRYDPDLNPSYNDMVAHYGTAVLPTRPYHPRDKPKVENAVLVVERWILARLRHQQFTSLHALNQAIKALLEELNNRPFQKMPGSRYSQFKELEQDALKPLPAKRYEYATFKHQLVNVDYHIEVDQHYYSVPHQYARETVDIRITAHMLEILKDGQRIASHIRSFKPGVTTLPDHMPEAHRQHCQWTPESCLQWAQSLGEATYALMHQFFKQKSHPRQVYRLFLGLLKLTKHFGADRLEAACKRAVFYENYSYKRVQAILEKGLDHEALPVVVEEKPPIDHANIRGAQYYK
jgi:transposase